MTISYKWISEYIPLSIEPEKVSSILTSIGLEVESMERYESVKGGLKDLVVGEVKECSQHPGADKLKLTRVDVGSGSLLQIVCGAPNVAVGQKVIVARVGVTIFPLKGEPITMKSAKIRGEQSEGMICAEDEIGVGESHDGIIVLPENLAVGSAVSDFYKPYSDWIFEIGLTPNRMDAMSHLGVARDVCAYLSHHESSNVAVKWPQSSTLESGAATALPISVVVENTSSCRRYSGVAIEGIEVAPSPRWLQEKLRAIGQRPINNIVDITNYLLHDAGQPLHAFDADKIGKKKIVVKNLPAGSKFKTLDERERTLDAEDLMICDGEEKGMCIAGVFGGINSGVSDGTKNIFLESAWFNPIDIRKTSFRHGLRTDAAARFEKNVDISQTLHVLKRAASLVVEIAGGKIASEFIDVYPSPAEQKVVSLDFRFLEKLSGKKYHPKAVMEILKSLGFEVLQSSNEAISIKVPYSKPDIDLPADIVEEIMRIDGYDNIDIPRSIMISPSTGAINQGHVKKEKIAGLLTGAGFNEIFTNSITNAAYFEGAGDQSMVRLLNNLSAVHNVMRPSMLETGLESVAYNINRKNLDLKFFEFGKTYSKLEIGRYNEDEHLCLYITGMRDMSNWNEKSREADVFYLKGVVELVVKACGISNFQWSVTANDKSVQWLTISAGGKIIGGAGAVHRKELRRFDIKQDVYFADINWGVLINESGKKQVHFQELPNQLPVTRDLAMILDADVEFGRLEEAIRKVKLSKLKQVTLFDVFASEKLGAGKKSLAVSFVFLDEEKTLTDKEIDGMMNKIMRTLEQDLRAEIRKGS